MKELLEIQSKLKRRALSLTKDKDDSEDLLQETNIRVLQHKERYRKEDIKKISFIIMRNIFINEYRKNKKNKMVTNKIPDIPCTYNPERYTVNIDILNKIDMLSPVLKGSFKLYIEGYKYEEIAEIEKQPLGTIKSRIHKARGIFKRLAI